MPIVIQPIDNWIYKRTSSRVVNKYTASEGVVCLFTTRFFFDKFTMRGCIIYDLWNEKEKET